LDGYSSSELPPPSTSPPGWSIKNFSGAAIRLTLSIELEHVRSVFVRHEKVCVTADGNALRIKTLGGMLVVGERIGVASERFPALALEETCLEQHRRDIWEGNVRIHRDAQKVEAVQVLHVGATVERAAVRHSEKYVVMAGEGDSGAKPAEGRPEACRWSVTIV
jgi:hypothetical protein